MSQKEKFTADVWDPVSTKQLHDFRRIMENETKKVCTRMLTESLKTKDKEIASLHAINTKFEKQIRSKISSLRSREEEIA